MRKRVVCLLLVVYLSLSVFGCSEKQVKVSEGYDFKMFGNGIEVYTELLYSNIYLSITNSNKVYYQAWLEHKYNSDTKKGNERQLIYKGNSHNYNIVITLPDDTTDTEHKFKIRILNSNGTLLYKTPLLNFKKRRK